MEGSSQVDSFLDEQLSRRFYVRGSSWMWVLEQLRRNLPEMNNLGFTAFFVHFVFFILKTMNIVFICQIIVYVVVIDSLFAFLLVTKYQINPISDVLSHKITF